MTISPRETKKGSESACSHNYTRLTMFGKRYYGLKGMQLNIAVGLIAGLDFLYVVCECSGHVNLF